MGGLARAGRLHLGWSVPQHSCSHPSLPCPAFAEGQFLKDFSDCMQRSHYRLIGAAEWEAAAAEAFLFTLPVAVDWSALDKRMLQRYWGDRPEQRAVLPDLSDRILIFYRGFEPVCWFGAWVGNATGCLGGGGWGGGLGGCGR